VTWDDLPVVKGYSYPKDIPSGPSIGGYFEFCYPDIHSRKDKTLKLIQAVREGFSAELIL